MIRNDLNPDGSVQAKARPEIHPKAYANMGFTILVCIKAVPDILPGAELAVGDRWIDETGVDWRMNLYDAHALEAALAIKDAFAAVRVDALSVGTDRVRPTIRRAMAIGADAGVHLAAEATGRLAPETIALAVAGYAAKKNYDLILTGVISEDEMNGTTGPMIAAALDRPCAAAAVGIALDPADGSLAATCEMEAGMAAIVRLTCPALVTVQTGSKPLRYPSLSNTLRSRRQPIDRVQVKETCRFDPAATRRVAFPQRSATCRVIGGELVQKADALLALFNDNGWLK